MNLEEDIRIHIKNAFQSIFEVDLDIVESGSYGYKAAAPRVRKVALTAIKELKELRAEIQDKKNSHS